MAAVSDELCKIFHPDISQVGKVYSGKQSSDMLALLLESYKGDTYWRK
jgi:hypothetical protein